MAWFGMLWVEIAILVPVASRAGAFQLLLAGGRYLYLGDTVRTQLFPIHVLLTLE